MLWNHMAYPKLRESITALKPLSTCRFRLTQQLERKFSGHFLKYQVPFTILKSSTTNLKWLWIFSSNYCIHANSSLNLLPFDEKILVWISYLVVRSSCLRVRLICLLLPATAVHREKAIKTCCIYASSFQLGIYSIREGVQK